MTSSNDPRRERDLRGSPTALGDADHHLSTVAANGGGPDANGTAPGEGGAGVERAAVSAGSGGGRNALSEPAEAEQLVEQLRSATALLEQELAHGRTDDDGWAELLVRIRAAARTEQAIAQAESQLLELRRRAAAEVDAVYEAAARRAEELVFEARSAAANFVQQARAEAAQMRNEAEAGAQRVGREAEGAAATILGEADREAGSKLAAAEVTLRNQLAEAEREAALVLERSEEQATTWMAETKQACVEMVNRAREEADRMLAAARGGTAEVSSRARRDTADAEWHASGHRAPHAAGLAGQPQPLTTRQHRAGIAPGEPVIGSRGSTTAFSTSPEPDDRVDDPAHRKRRDRDDRRSGEPGRRRRFGS